MKLLNIQKGKRQNGLHILAGLTWEITVTSPAWYVAQLNLYKSLPQMRIFNQKASWFSLHGNPTILQYCKFSKIPMLFSR